MIDPETSTFQDEEITCVDCHTPFIWTAGEQEFFEGKGFKDRPKRCKPCREQRKVDRANGVEPQTSRKHEFVCPSCGKPASVPFVPRGNALVYCRECFKKQPRKERERR